MLAPKIFSTKMFAINQATSIYGVTVPFNNLFKTFGFTVFTVSNEKSEELTIKSTILDYFRNLIAFSVYAVLLVRFIMRGDIGVTEVTRMTSVTTYIFGVTGLGFSCMGTAFAIFIRNRLASILCVAFQFDKKFETLGARVPHERHRRLVWRAFSVCIVFLALFSCISGAMSWHTTDISLFFETTICYFLLTNAWSWFLFLIVLTITFVKVRFKLLNEHLVSTLSSFEGIHQAQNKEFDMPEFIIELARLHDKLNDIVELINECYSFQMMTVISCWFLLVVSGLYSLFICYYHGGSEEQVLGSFKILVWTVYYSAFILIFLWIASSTTKEGRHTAVVVHKGMNSSTNKDVKMALSQFSQQLVHRQPIFSSGFVTYDWTLLFTIAGSIASYLVILIQFAGVVNGVESQ